MKKLITVLLVLVTLNSYSQTEQEIQSYYDTIVYYVEGSNNRQNITKYKKDILIHVVGDKKPHLMLELNNIINELNDLITSVNIKIVDGSSKYNMLVYLGTVKEYSKITKDILKRSSVHGFGLIYSDLQSNISYSEVFVNLGKVKDVKRQKHILREEITQAMGLTNDTNQYFNSIFYQGYSSVTEYSNLDKEVIKLFYN
jgi:metal-responsive CopG/Arc/MetJ family transcriptional regulator